ncbi:MAG TPA: AI-2E family transporter [Burkholderiaceae bacterium]|nr:AI-2E family transporter [Burkholderiaceae bacterium]
MNESSRSRWREAIRRISGMYRAGIVTETEDGVTPKEGAETGVRHRETAAGEQSADILFLRRVLTVIGLVLVAGLTVWVLVHASGVFLLLFAGVLFAVFLRAPTNWLAHRTPLSENAALGVTIVGCIVLFAVLAWMFSAPLGEQIGQLTQTLPAALTRVQQWAAQYYWARPLAALIGDIQNLKLDVQLLGRATGMISSTFQAIFSLVVVLFIGFYLAAQPRMYQRGFLALLPPRARPRAYEVLDRVGQSLRWWLLGRLITMIAVGSAAGIGLWWLDIPLAFTLGIMTGLLEFIPYLGPILSALPALLIAFNIDPMQAFYVLLLFVGIQSAENYLLSPVIEQRTVSLPPALVIFSTLLLATIFGALGVVLASPLTATCIVVIKLLYMQDMEERLERSVGPAGASVRERSG